MSSLKDIFAIGQCWICDSLFLIEIVRLPLSLHNGKAAAKRAKVKDSTSFLDSLEALSTRLYAEGLCFERCPTCNELAACSKYADWLQTQQAALFSPVSWLTFDNEDQQVPLYLLSNKSSSSSSSSSSLGSTSSAFNSFTSSSEFTLCHGVGPQTLSLDHSFSGRLYKNDLRKLLLDIYGYFYPQIELPQNDIDKTYKQAKKAVEKKCFPLPEHIRAGKDLQRIVDILYECFYYLKGRKCAIEKEAKEETQEERLELNGYGSCDELVEEWKKYRPFLWSWEKCEEKMEETIAVLKQKLAVQDKIIQQKQHDNHHQKQQQSIKS